jgi:uncharacterized OB-fold protein
MTPESADREKEDREDGEMAIGERGFDSSIEVEYAKPVPRPDQHSQPFFDGTLRGELMLQRCGDCGTWMWPVRSRCIACFGADVIWAPARGTGTLYSYTLVHQVFHPGFAGEVPYNVAMIDLEEGVRMITNIVGLPNDELRVGLPVVVTFERISDDLALPKFRPVEA